MGEHFKGMDGIDSDFCVNRVSEVFELFCHHERFRTWKLWNARIILWLQVPLTRNCFSQLIHSILMAKLRGFVDRWCIIKHLLSNSRETLQTHKKKRLLSMTLYDFNFAMLNLISRVTMISRRFSQLTCIHPARLVEWRERERER